MSDEDDLRELTDDDVAADDHLRFAADLRELRVAAGSPTLAALAGSTGVSKTVLSEALAGRRLPSARTVAAIVRAVGGDVGPWLRRRDALDGRTSVSDAADGSDVPAPPESNEPGIRRVPVIRRGTALALAAAAFVVGGIVSGVVTGLVASDGHAAVADGVGASTSASAATSAGPAIVVADGTDPADTACVDDAEVAASETRAHDTQLQIVYSAACHAAWSRITRYDDRSDGNTVTTSIYRQIAPNASDRQSTTEPDAQSAYTTLLVRPTPATRLCAVGSITLDGTTIDLGDPLCL